jgi:hypothetical protein
MSTSIYPVRVDAALEPQLNRWLWLVKWILVIPHYIVLFFLWIAFGVLSVVAFVAILFTGRYPRTIFDFNVGVLRWSWRVAYYAYGALGTDRYPPFSLEDVPDYPAHLSVEYPEHLSRGLVLVKWWLLAIPHYLVVGVFLGGGLYVASGMSDSDWSTAWSGGLIGLLVLMAALVLLFTGRYPQAIFDFVLGMNRWVLRVAAYAALMTDEYPPFRFDQGGPDPGSGDVGVPTVHPGASTPGSSSDSATGTALRQAAAPSAPLTPASPARGWTGGRIATVVIGSVLLVSAGGLLTGGIALAVADQSMRDEQGFLMTGEEQYTAAGFAIASEPMELHANGAADFIPEVLLGDAKIQVDPVTEDKEVFVGVADSADADAYLGGVQHSTVSDFRGDSWNDAGPVYQETEGAAPTTPPGDANFWVAKASGLGEQRAVMDLESGDWTIVVMNADGSSGVSAEVAVGATFPAIEWVVATLLLVGGFLLLLALALIIGAVRRAGRSGR